MHRQQQDMYDSNLRHAQILGSQPQLSISPQDFCNLVDCPIDLLLADDKWWRKPDHGFVCFLAEQAALPLALCKFRVHCSQRWVDLDADKQAASAHSLINGLSIAWSLPIRYRPLRRFSAARPSSMRIFSASNPTAAASGLPPKVLPWSPGVKTPMTSRRARNIDTGRIPPPSALPSIRPSGCTSSCSQASILPVRPSPV